MNSYTTQGVVFGQSFIATVLAALKTVPGGALITAGKIRLSKDPSFNPTSQNLISDLTPMEADYSGYAAGGIAAVLSAPVNLSSTADGVVASGLFMAAAASPFVSNNCYGYWIDDGTNVICGERFGGGGPAGFGRPGDFLSLTVLIPEQLIQAAV